MENRRSGVLENLKEVSKLNENSENIMDIENKNKQLAKKIQCLERQNKNLNESIEEHRHYTQKQLRELNRELEMKSNRMELYEEENQRLNQ
jgi:ferritin-like metal-binding protein YciE